MAFSLDSVDRQYLPENGGHEINVSGTFEDGHRYQVHVGEDGLSSDLPCYSGKASQGNEVYPRGGKLRCYSPIIGVGLTLSVYVVDLDTLENHVLADVMSAVPRQYHSQVFNLRKVFPPFYKTGPRNLDQAPAV